MNRPVKAQLDDGRNMHSAFPTLTETANSLVWAGTLVVLQAPLVLARADTIYLRSGEKLIGKIIKDERAEIIIESQALGRLKIPRERVERVELDLSSVWDRISHPQADSSGIVPEKNDYRLNLSLGVKF